MEAALKLWDFGDSGAFAEIHVPQFPLGFGDSARDASIRARAANAAGAGSGGAPGSNSAATVASSALMIVQTAQSSLVASRFDADELAKPNERQLQQLADQTARDLETARRRAAGSDAGGTVQVGRKIGAGGSGTRTEVIRDANTGRTFAVTEVGRDVAAPRQMQLEKVKAGGAAAAATDGPGGGAVVAYDPEGNAALIRSEVPKLTAQEKAAFAVPRAVFSGRNPKSLLIDTSEREKHDGFNYIDHTNVSPAHAEAARAMAEASARADAEERLRQRDAQREKTKKDEEDRERLMKEAAEALRSAAAGAPNGAGIMGGKDRAREAQERKKLHALQRTAEALGVNVEDLIEQDEDVQIELPPSSSRAGGDAGRAHALGGAFDSRIGRALTHGDADEGFFGGQQRRRGRDDDDDARGNARTGVVQSGLSSVLGNVDTAALEQEQRLQMAMGRKPTEQRDNAGEEDEDDDVFGVNELL